MPQVKNRLDSALACVAEVRPRERVPILHVRSARLNSPLSDTNLPEMPISRQTQRSQKIRDKISSLGGIQCMIALFRSPDATKELKVVATLAIAYILPSYVKSSDSPSSSLGLKIMKCLHFLVTTSDPVTPRGGEISVTEIRQASIMGVLTF